MTARVQRNFEFVSGVYVENELYLNSYNIEMNFIVETDNIYEQNIALDRIKYFFTEKLDNAIFVSEEENECIDKLSTLDFKCIVLPEEPYDQIIGIMLMVKTNAISENRLTVSDIRITSRMSDGVSYLHSMEESIGPFSSKGWWKDLTPTVSSNKSKNRKIVKFKEAKLSWDDLGLSWVPSKKELFSDVVVEFESKTEK